MCFYKSTSKIDNGYEFGTLRVIEKMPSNETSISCSSCPLCLFTLDLS